MTHIGACLAFWLLVGITFAVVISDGRGEPNVVIGKWISAGLFGWMACSVWMLIP